MNQCVCSFAITFLRLAADAPAAPSNGERSFKPDLAASDFGPMSQDFHTAFGVGPDDKHIATVDAGGVALAAIQGLNQKVEAESQKSEARSQKLEAENAELKARLSALEKLVANLNSKGN